MFGEGTRKGILGIEVDEYEPGLDPGGASDADRWPGDDGSEMGFDAVIHGVTGEGSREEKDE